MTFRAWLDAWTGNPNRRATQNRSRRPRRKPTGYQLSVLALEGRTVPALLAPVSYAVGTSPQAVLTADFNNDGNLDVATASYSDSTVSVLLGNGDGTFQAAQNSTTVDPALGSGANPRSLAVGDFDGDGNLDVVTVNNTDVSILLGNGAGALRLTEAIGLPAQTVPDYTGELPQTPLSVAVGDLTGDGLLDLAVTASTTFTTRQGPYRGYDYWGNPYDFYTYQWHTNGHVNVLVGDGSGDFAAPAAGAVRLLDGTYPISVVLDDLDGTPGLDLAVADSNAGRVRVLSGNNDGTFDAPVDYATGWNPASVLTGDVNGDGVSDLVTANYYSASVLLGNGAAGTGDGTFQPPQHTGLNYYTASVAVGDVDADGRLDLVAASNYYYYGYEGQVSVLLGRGNGTFGAPRTTGVAGTYFTGVASGDFDADGFPDVAVTEYYFGAVSVLTNDQYWPPTPPPTVSIDDVTVTEGNTGTTTATFTVWLSHAADDDVTVHYATADGSATAGDYATTSGDVTIPAGELSRTITVAVAGDRLGEATETFAVNLTAPVHATLGDDQGVGTILDDEPLVSINDVTVTEGNAGSVTATFTVRLSAVSDIDVTVHYATANGTATAGDYTATSGDLVIPHGQLSRTFTVAVTGDRLGEADETFVVNLTAPVNAGIADGQGVGTVLDNEPRISINSVTKKEGNGGTTQFVFTVSLSVAYDQAVTVSYATANGTATAGVDYTAKTGTLTFAPGVRSMTITVIVLPDKARETDETFFVNLSGPSSNAYLGVAQGVGTIRDDDLPPGKKK